jgi:nucleoside-triphosphatase THEP1
MIELQTRHILITGVPGVGKTTLIKALCQDLASVNPVGFYTEEIRERVFGKVFAGGAGWKEEDTGAHSHS